jgi:alanine racemase
MNRIGFKDGEELLSAYKILDKKQVKHVGIFSHIYNNSVISDVKKQFVKFEKLLQFIPN